MPYADYAYYSEIYMGTVPEYDFLRLSARADAFLDYYTQNHAKDHADLESIKLCACALIDKYAVIEAANDMAVSRIVKAKAAGFDTKSESVGSYSRTVADGAESAAAALSVAESANKLLAETCNAYLAHTGLLYRGGVRKCTLPTL